MNIEMELSQEEMMKVLSDFIDAIGEMCVRYDRENDIWRLIIDGKEYSEEQICQWVVEYFFDSDLWEKVEVEIDSSFIFDKLEFTIDGEIKI